MITRKAIIDAWTSIRRLNDTIPDEVIDFLRDAAIEKHERLLKPTTVEEMESSGHSFTEGMDIGATKRCTQPNCDCIEQAEQKAGGPVKSYQCLAPSELPRMKSAHKTATIDEQIEFMETVKRTMVVPFKFEAEIGAVINTLRTSQVFEHQRMLIQNIHFEKLIEDLIQVIVDAGLNRSNGVPIEAIQNAEAALGMIDAFKKKSSPPEWVKNFAQVKTEAFDLRSAIVDRLVDVHGKYAIADAIILAIELKCNGANRA